MNELPYTELGLLSPVFLNVVRFRYAPQGFGADELNLINEEILLRIQEEGTAPHRARS